MCGIIGWYCFGGDRPSSQELKELLIAAASRGTDATGIGFVEHGRLVVHKAPEPAVKFVKTLRMTEPLPKILIGHTRQATTGRPSNNMNNHPVFNKHGLALVHNGMVHNSTHHTRDAEVDSEIFLHVMGTTPTWHKRLSHVAKHVHGSWAVAVIDAVKAEDLCMFRHDNPIALYLDKSRDILFFGSTPEILTSLCPLWHGLHDTYQATFLTVPNNTAIVVTPSGCTTQTMNISEERFLYVPWTDTQEMCDVCGTHVSARTTRVTFEGYTLCESCWYSNREE